MTHSSVSFKISRGTLSIATSPDGDLLQSDETTWGKHLQGALENLYAAIRTVLDRPRQAALLDDRYPVIQARSLLGMLGWKGLAELGSAMGRALDQGRPSPLKLVMSDNTLSLLTDLLPIELSGEVRWLDTLGPSLWTLPQFKTLRRPVPAAPKKLAIIYQSDDKIIPFITYAEKLLDELNGDESGKHLKASTFDGGEFPTNSHSRRHRMLEKIFYNHHAVIFLGHLSEPEGEGGERGWCLSPGNVLRMTELAKFFGVRIRDRKLEPAQAGQTMAELVFANCCSSATHDLPGGRRFGLPYPHLFLAAGTRFFIGSTMRVIYESPDLSDTVNLMKEFFRRWALEPDRAVDHLYEAKRAGGFSLRTSLFRIYGTSDELIQDPDRRAGQRDSRPQGAMVEAPRAGDRLGNYTLVRELWSDGTGRMFAARRGRDKNPFMIQVLPDELQLSESIEADLDEAVRRLHEAGLNEQHLVPDRHELLKLERGGRSWGWQLVLVYERPEGEPAEAWQRLEIPAGGDPAWVMDTGLELSRAIAGLHERGLAHGNLRPESLLARIQDGRRTVVIKDAWLLQAGRGGSLQVRQPGGERPQAADGLEAQRAGDMRKLGLMLLEMLGPEASRPHIPEALKRLIRNCLAPETGLLPPAREAVRELEQGSQAGGDYVSAFENHVKGRIMAGQRLLAILTDDAEEAEATLRRLATRPARPGTPKFRLFLGNLEEGLVDAENGRHPFPDLPDRMRLPVDPLNPGSREAKLFRAIARLASDETTRAMVALRWGEWWHSPRLLGPAWRTEIERILRSFQAQPRQAPAVLIINHRFPVSLDVSRHFELLNFPDPVKVELYWLLAELHRKETGRDPETATLCRVVELLHPCAARQARSAARQCLLLHGALDERILGLLDEERQQNYRETAGIRYIPSSRLDNPEWVALPAELAGRVSAWVQAVREARKSSPAGLAPRRVLIHGPAGCGKTALAHSLAARLDRPVIEVNPLACLGGGLGESERCLGEALARAGSQAGAFVLLKDADRFMGREEEPGRDAGGAASTLLRMSGLLLRWLDALPPPSVAALTTEHPGRLAPQLRRRIEAEFHMPELNADLPYRRALVQALFLRFGLEKLAGDDALAARIADPDEAAGRLDFRAPADVKHWMQETILRRAGAGENPETPQFWERALAH